MIGEKFERWTVLASAGKTKGGHLLWLCECVCGETRKVRGTSLRNGKSNSCGCIMREVNSHRLRTHGMTNTKIFRAWQSMLDRCNNENSTAYPYYGGRGIYVSERWLSFENFKADMYESYLKHVEIHTESNTSLDRINNDEGYYLENCRWATSLVQMRNRRKHINNKSGYRGVTKTQYGTWRVYISDNNGEQISLGTFKNIDEAIGVRIEAEEKYWGKAEVIECQSEKAS